MKIKFNCFSPDFQQVSTKIAIPLYKRIITLAVNPPWPLTRVRAGGQGAGRSDAISSVSNAASTGRVVGRDPYGFDIILMLSEGGWASESGYRRIYRPLGCRQHTQIRSPGNIKYPLIPVQKEVIGILWFARCVNYDFINVLT